MSIECTRGGTRASLTSSCEDGDMDAEYEAAVRQVQSTNDIASDSSFLVVLAPIDVWSACATSTIEDVCRLDAFEHLRYSFTVFHADCGLLDCLPLAFE